MTAIAACALTDIEDPSASPIQKLADLAARAMRMVRLAVAQYEVLITQTPEMASPRNQPDPGTLFTRAARVVLDCITKESRLAAGLPLVAVRGPGAVSRAENPAPETSCRNDSVEPVRQALRSATRNHPHGEKLLRQGLEHLDLARATAPSQPIALPDLLLRVCAAAGIRLEPSQRRKLARDPVLESLRVEAPVPS